MASMAGPPKSSFVPAYGAAPGKKVRCGACGRRFIKLDKEHHFVDIPGRGPLCVCGLCETCETMAVLRA